MKELQPKEHQVTENRANDGQSSKLQTARIFDQTTQFIADVAAIELAKLLKMTDWQSRYRIIMQLGKQLPGLDLADKCEQHLVNGCESAAWLLIHKAPLQFAFDSEARVVKGIVALVLASWHQQNRQANFLQLWQQLNLGAELSPSRNNGVWAVLTLMQQAQD
jgi:cysteine desulfuration protein SufE